MVVISDRLCMVCRFAGVAVEAICSLVRGRLLIRLLERKPTATNVQFQLPVHSSGEHPRLTPSAEGIIVAS
jgi:hypothetical protein